MDRYDVLTVRESNGKSYFSKLGAMFPSKSGDGFVVLLDAVPASVDGQYRLIVKRPLERDGQGGGTSPTGRARPAQDDDLDDSMPFISADQALEVRIR